MLSLIMQTEGAECGLACLAMVAKHHGQGATLRELRRRFNISLKGMSLAHIVEIARALGFETRAVRVELDQLRALTMPCILHWNLNHFVVLNRVTRKGAEIYDPSAGVYRMPLKEVSKHLTGVALELTPSTSFSKSKSTGAVSIWDLGKGVRGLKPLVLQVICIALGIEGLTLVIPFQMQLVVDHILISSDRSLLIETTIAFLAVAAFQLALTIARGWLITWAGATLNAQWVTNLFSHLLQLPLDFFEKRHIGDVVSRFNSIGAIQGTLTGSFVQSVLDGIMGSLAFVLLCVYSVELSAIVSLSVLTYVALRALLYRRLWLINEEQLIYGARQQSELLESIRGIQPIKIANKQGERRSRLINATLDATKRDMQRQRINMTFTAFNQGLFSVQRIVLIALGAWLCISGVFSVGALVAFLAYTDLFATRMGGLIDKIVEFRMLRLHAERIADIALASSEAYMEGKYVGEAPVASIAMKNVSFRYAEGESWVLRNLNLVVEAGQSLAIVGPSGCGKSTIAKIMLGLLEPTEGSVEIGGIDIREYGLRRYRNITAAVMQDDQLFVGTIADNIAFFDEDASMERVEDASRAAALHEVIMSMPMRYQTLVGDMGSALSGGQKQRIILARALYRRPKILILDEATSHLDLPNEARVSDAIGKFSATRVIIAHRKETIGSADKVHLIELRS